MDGFRNLGEMSKEERRESIRAYRKQMEKCLPPGGPRFPLDPEDQAAMRKGLTMPDDPIRPRGGASNYAHEGQQEMQSAPRPQRASNSELVIHMEEQTKIVEDLHSLLCELEERLGAVMFPSPGVAAGGEKIPDEVMSPLGAAIRHINGRLRFSITIVRGMIERLAL